MKQRALPFRSPAASLLDQACPFIDGALSREGAEDAYYPPDISAVTASVYEHCARIAGPQPRAGAHGLPLMALATGTTA
jgi:cyclic beta-1,2-glucan synthetase